MRELSIGYIPLTDAAVVIAAAERGFAARHGLAIRLAREASWATLRDKLVLGHVDAAHMLAPLAIATSMGLGPGPRLALTVPFALNLNGNAITLSRALWDVMDEMPGAGVARVARALGRASRSRAAAGLPALTLATVFPFSSHTYLLRRFLAAGGIDPDRDVRITVMPPPYMADALRDGTVDGFCVGSPWNSAAVASGAGRIAAIGPEIVPDAPEKVLALSPARLGPETVGPLVATLKEAAAWCSLSENRAELAALLAEPRHLGIPAELLRPTLDDRLPLASGGPFAIGQGYLRLGGGVHRPDRRHAGWILGEMVSAGQVAPGAADAGEAEAIYDPAAFDRA